MKEQLISLETAKLAKEKGFYMEGTTDRLYVSKDENLPNINNVVLKYNDYIFPLKEEYLNHKTVNTIQLSDERTFYMHPYWAAPTQSLLQKWLREKHDIHIWVEPWIDQDHCKTYELKMRKHMLTGPVFDKVMEGCDFLEDVPFAINEFKSYEEALEAGLLEGLKLIP
jgi:hypothetical protein